MGLRMEDLHTPTVPSAQKPGGTGHESASKRSIHELMAEKREVESELLALSGVLDSHGANMNTSLTTFDGYPRDDIDVAQIRTTRARIIRLRNDYKALMDQIEIGLQSHYSATEATMSQHPRALQQDSTHTRAQSSPLLEAPFAKVNSVDAGGPAEAAGLKSGDTIRRFGGANWMNNEKLKKVAEIVSQNEGRPILVKVSRRYPNNQDQEELQMELIPRRNWGGRGLLGCHLLPI